MVAECSRRGIELDALSDAELKGFHRKLGPAVRAVLDPVTSVRRRSVIGGPAPRRVRAEVKRWQRRLEAEG